MKRLIVAPHCDDEVLWNFAVLPGSTVVILSDQFSMKHISQQVAEEIGYEVKQYEFNPNHLTEDFHAIKDLLETELASNGYDQVFIPCRTHQQDHTLVNQIMRIATRPSNILVRLKSVYEYPYWDINHFDYTTLLKVGEEKFRYAALFSGQEKWANYVQAYNRYIALKYEYEGYFEPFRVIFERKTLEPGK